LLAGGWAVLNFTFGSIASDVSDIKTRLTAAQTEVKAAESKGMEADTSIRQALSNIDKNVAVMTEQTASFQSDVRKRLDTIQTNEASVNNSVDKLFGQIEAMNIRLVRIEEKVSVDPLKFEKQPSPELQQPENQIAPLPQPQPQ
jgi:phage-related minor tail protein